MNAFQRPPVHGSVYNTCVMNTGITAINEAVQEASQFVHPLLAEMHKVVVGQSYLVERLLISLLADGHVLLEGVPGLAKTLSVKTLAQAVNTQFQRIQFTTKKGPLFSNIILADEINRAPAKVQSALLEAMQERQITLGGQTYKLDDPFMVMATQNPIEQEGTYPL